MNHIELANQYCTVKREHKNLERKAAAAWKVLKAIEVKLLEAMTEEGVGNNFRLDDESQICKREYFNVSVTKTNREQTRQWLMDTYGDDSDFVDEVINKSALQDRIREEIDSKQKYAVEYPDFLNVKTSDGIVVRDLAQETK
jgi:hypothetical protein